MCSFAVTLAIETNTFSPLPIDLAPFLRPGQHPEYAPRM